MTTDVLRAEVLRHLGYSLGKDAEHAKLYDWRMALSLAVRDEEQGAVAGYNSSAQALGRMLGPVGGTALYQLKPAYPYAAGSGLLVVVLLVLLAVPQLLTSSSDESAAAP